MLEENPFIINPISGENINDVIRFIYALNIESVIASNLAQFQFTSIFVMFEENNSFLVKC